MAPREEQAATILDTAHHVGIAPEQPRSIRNVLVCLDRSPFAEACVPYGRFVADAFNAKMTLLHVIPSLDEERESSRANAIDWEIKRREATLYLTQIQSELARERVGSELATTEVTQGRPAERIVALADATEADLTILASHGEDGAGELNLGSTAQQVVALLRGSMLIVPTHAGASHNVPPKRIVIGIDGSLRTESVLPEVARLACFHGAEVVLVHVVSEPKASAVLASEEDLTLARSLASKLEGGAQQYLTRLRDHLFQTCSRVEIVVLRHTDIRRALLEVASQRQADLLVLAAHGSTCDAERPFGSVASYALSHGKLPLLVLQDLLPSERPSRHPPSGDAPIGVRASCDVRSLEET